MPTAQFLRGRDNQIWRAGRLLFLLLALSFAGKAAFRLVVFHNPNYWESGYSLYFDLADTFLRTGSFYEVDPDSSATGYRAFSKPLYPLLIAAVCKLTHYSGEAFVLVEALISTLTVVLVYAITVRLAPPPAAFLSALLYAFYPYAFYHDTQLQENVLWNALALATVACLLAAIDGKRGYLFFLAGTLAGGTIATRVSHSTATLFLLGLILFVFRHERKLACRFAGAFSLGTLVLVGPWLVRNKLVVDHFTLTSETGFALARAITSTPSSITLTVPVSTKAGVLSTRTCPRISVRNGTVLRTMNLRRKPGIAGKRSTISVNTPGRRWGTAATRSRSISWASCRRCRGPSRIRFIRSRTGS